LIPTPMWNRRLWRNLGKQPWNHLFHLLTLAFSASLQPVQPSAMKDMVFSQR
jgi:hypothetical protein